MTSFLVAAFYKFVDLPDYAELQEGLQAFARERDIMGTILLASEGINGTVAGPEKGMLELLAFIRKDPRLSDLEHKESWAEENPFYRIKVRLKKEIVTLGVEGISPTRKVGEYVPPSHWNDLISDPEVLVVDTRNDYEVAIGTFEGAVNPQTNSFRDFPQWLDAQQHLSKTRKIAMFCTGGIRCEKSTALLKERGFENVYHLEGGILKYLETVSSDESMWNGQCFVFDQRVSVGHDLKQGDYDLCHACRHPITEDDKASNNYVPGVSCPNCHGTMTKEQVKKFSERQRQIELAQARGDKHIAADQAQQKARKQEALKEHILRSEEGSRSA